MVTANKMTKVILGVVIAGLMLGYVFPVGLNAINEDPDYDITAEEDVKTEISSPLYVNVTDTNPGTDATVELINNETGDTQSQTINEGNSYEYTNLDGGDVNVTVNSVDSASPNTTDMTVTAPDDFGWSGAESQIYSVIGIFLVIIPLVVLGKEAMNA